MKRFINVELFDDVSLIFMGKFNTFENTKSISLKALYVTVKCKCKRVNLSQLGTKEVFYPFLRIIR